jgi:predicted phosphodiesterase
MKYSESEQFISHFDINEKAKSTKVLILSDLHFDEAIDSKHAVDAMLTFFTAEEWRSTSIDLVFVAGDLENHGGKSAYTQFTTFCSKLKELACFKFSLFYACPGNHDLTRRNGPTDNKSAVYNFLSALTAGKTNFAVEESYTKEIIIDIVYSALKTCNDTGSYDKLFEQVKILEQTIFSSYCYMLDKQPSLFDKSFNTGSTNLNTVYAASVLGIDILSVNSSWFCGLLGRDKEKLFLIYPLIRKLLEDITANNTSMRSVDDDASTEGSLHKNVTIALMHHPYSWLHQSEYNAPEGDDSAQTFTQISDAADLVINGHEHGVFMKPHSFNSNTHILVNGCSYSPDKINKKFWPATMGVLTIEKIANRFTLERVVYNSDDTTAGEGRWIKKGPGFESNYLRPKAKWNFSIDEELYYQTIQVVRFLDLFILSKSIPAKGKKLSLLQKQVNDAMLLNPEKVIAFGEESNHVLEDIGDSVYADTKSDRTIGVWAIPAERLLQTAEYEFSPYDFITTHNGDSTVVKPSKNVFFIYEEIPNSKNSNCSASLMRNFNELQTAISNLNNKYGLCNGKSTGTINVFHKKVIITCSDNKTV